MNGPNVKMYRWVIELSDSRSFTSEYFATVESCMADSLLNKEVRLASECVSSYIEFFFHMEDGEGSVLHHLSYTLVNM